jgi:hypothetical protein
MLLDYGSYGAAAVRRRADVALVHAACQAFIVESSDKRFCRFPVSAIAGGHICSLLCQAVCDRAADPACPAGDERDSAS